MKIYEWNIRGAANFSCTNNYCIPRWIVNEVLKDNPDCIVLTEFVLSTGWDYLQSRLYAENYNWFTSLTTGKNGILIAIKKNRHYDFSQIFHFEDDTINNSEVLNEKKPPDFYEVRLKINKEDVSIIGIRVKKDINCNKGKYYTREQLNVLDNYLIGLGHKVICIGDFNAYWGSYWNTKKNITLPHTSQKYNLYTPVFNHTDGFSYVLPNGEKVQLDHLITNINWKSIECKYDWDFVSAGNGYAQYEKDSPNKPNGLPDHAIFKVEAYI